MKTELRCQGRQILVLVLLASAYLVGCEGCGPSQVQLHESAEHARQLAASARAEALRAAELEGVSDAITAAQPLVSQAVASFRPHGETAYAAHCGAMLGRESDQDTLACVDEAAGRGYNGWELRLIRADALVGLTRFEEARPILFSIRDESPTLEGLSERLVNVFAADPHFLGPVVSLETGLQVDRVRSLGGGSTITLKFKLNDVNVAAFKPEQTRRQSNYRAEVAAFRLCPMIRCGFEIPYSFEARLERRQFMRLYGIRSLDPVFLETHEGYARNFVDLIWQHEDDGRSYLYGVWKDWVPHFTQFPIEYDDVWDSWVVVGGELADLEQPLEDALRPLRGRERGHYRELLEEAGDLTTRGLATQISNMLAFDYLINNWDRFSGTYWGVNCQFANGHFVSIDNGAGFMTRDPDRPEERLRQATRFSRGLVQEVRLLDREALLPILFPDPTSAELEKFESFWQRREEFLNYVDGLIEEHGEDAVLFFD